MNQSHGLVCWEGRMYALQQYKPDAQMFILLNLYTSLMSI